LARPIAREDKSDRTDDGDGHEEGRHVKGGARIHFDPRVHNDKDGRNPVEDAGDRETRVRDPERLSRVVFERRVARPGGFEPPTF
jgi:hypothetical protein